jgi:mannan endo-1,4-beta-mannosidase
MKQKHKKIQQETDQSKNKTISFIINIVILCFLGFIMYKAYSPLVNMLPRENINSNLLVKRNGTNLMFGNQNFHVVGVNDYDLAHKSNKIINQTFISLHKAGVTTIRFWLFDDGEPDGFQPSAGIYNETRFKQADYIFYEAQKYNMKVIPVLVNNWTDYGGKDQYIRWIGKNPATDETIFYTDNKIKSLFENYISYVLARKNTYTNINYADDPSILGWDIMNEPRSTNQNAMNTWLVSIAQYIKQHDPNHLVFAGTEEAIVPSPTSEGKSSELCASQYIDVCSIHLYLYDTTQPLYNNFDEVISFMQSQKTYAEKINKPLILEEFGIPQNTTPFGENPLSIMKQIIDATKQEGYAGYLIWDWSDTQTSPLTFSPNGNSQGNYSLTNLEQLLN